MMSKNTKIKGITAKDGSTKARIERAALMLFAERGVDAVTTREIAAACEISEGALYRHFPGKEALAQTLFLAIHTKLSKAVQRAGAQHDDIEAQAKAVVHTYCQIADDDWALFAYHLITTHRFLPSPDRPEMNKKDSPVTAIEAMIAKAMQRGELPDGNVALRTSMALGVVLQTALHRFYGGVDGKLSAHQDALTRSVIAVLKA